MPICHFSTRPGELYACCRGACHDLAERNARLWREGKVSAERRDELRRDLEWTCPWAVIYYDWLYGTGRVLSVERRRHAKLHAKLNSKLCARTWLRS